MVSIRKTSSVPSFLSQASFSPSVQFQTVPRVLVKAVKLTGDAAKPVTIQVGGGGGVVHMDYFKKMFRLYNKTLENTITVLNL